MTYIAYDAYAAQFEICNTFEEAEKWLLEGARGDEGFTDEFIDGHCVIAKVTHVSAVKITDKKENYMCVRDDDVPANCSSCEDSQGCDDGEEWPYENDFDWVGEPYIKPVDDKCNCSRKTVSPGKGQAGGFAKWWRGLRKNKKVAEILKWKD